MKGRIPEKELIEEIKDPETTLERLNVIKAVWQYFPLWEKIKDIHKKEMFRRKNADF